MKVLIIGGGIIGLAAAYYLQQQGQEVVVLDQGNMAGGCSYGNAGMVVPSHFIPLAAPGMIAKGIRWMFDSQSPFYIKPQFNPDLISWAWKFYRAASVQRMKQSMPLLRDFGLLSKNCYQDWVEQLGFSFAYTQKGLFMLCQQKHSLKEEVHTAQLANQMGIEAQVLGREEIKRMEPRISEQVIGAVFYPGDAHLDPQLLMEGLKKKLSQGGATFLSNTKVTDFEINQGRLISVIANDQKMEADEFILAGGAWSAGLVKKLGVNMPLQAGKGYSITLDQAPQLQHAAILTEAKIAVTPLGQQMRFGGTMEIAGINHQINLGRVKGIVNAIPKYYQDYPIEMPTPGKIWSGLRPCSPDGLPYLGRLKKIKNLTIATGHAMMGVSLAPATGLLVSELIGGKTLSLNLDLLDPQRFD